MSERPNPSSLPPSIRPDPKSVEEIDEAWGEAEPALSQPRQNAVSGDLFPAQSRATRPGPEPDLTRLKPAIVEAPAQAASAQATPEQAAPASGAQVQPTSIPGGSASGAAVSSGPVSSGPVDSLEPRELGGSEPRPQASRRGWVYAAVGVAALGAVFVFQGRDEGTVEPAPAARPQASAPPVATVATEDTAPDTVLAEERAEAPENTASPAASAEQEARAEAHTEASTEGEGEVPEEQPAAGADAAEAAEKAQDPAQGATRQVRLRVVPPDAEIYRQGKRVGKGEALIEIEPGERKAFEVYREGYGLRKVTLDGSESEVTIGLRPNIKSSPKR